MALPEPAEPSQIDYDDERDLDRISMCRQMALSQACHDHKGSAPIRQTIMLASTYEDYLYGGAAYALEREGATPAR